MPRRVPEEIGLRGAFQRSLASLALAEQRLASGETWDVPNLAWTAIERVARALEDVEGGMPPPPDDEKNKHRFRIRELACRLGFEAWRLDRAFNLRMQDVYLDKFTWTPDREWHDAKQSLKLARGILGRVATLFLASPHSEIAATRIGHRQLSHLDALLEATQASVFRGLYSPMVNKHLDYLLDMLKFAEDPAGRRRRRLVMFMAAQRAWHQGQPDAAYVIDSVLQAYQSAPDPIRIRHLYKLKAVVTSQELRFESSFPALEQAYAMANGDWKFRIALQSYEAQMHAREGRLEDGLAIAGHAMNAPILEDLGPDAKATTAITLGRLLVFAGRYEEAERHLMHVIDISQGQAQHDVRLCYAALGLVHLYNRTGDLDKRNRYAMMARRLSIDRELLWHGRALATLLGRAQARNNNLKEGGDAV
jgi:tetratricopeptide (TPR) repeat protein